MDTPITAGAADRPTDFVMNPLPQDPEDADACDVAAGGRSGAWAAAAVLVIAVVLASGAVG